VKWLRRKRKDNTGEVMHDLRERALHLNPEEVHTAAEFDAGGVWGALMEIGHKEAVSSLVVLADGTTSLYFSSGGGILGAGEHSGVRAASAAFVRTAESLRSHLVPAQETPLPDVGRVRFYVHSTEGLLAAEADEQDLGDGTHVLSELFHAGHDVITQVRVVTEARRQ
jgi:hypothetical protein